MCALLRVAVPTPRGATHSHSPVCVVRGTALLAPSPDGATACGCCCNADSTSDCA